MQQPLILPRFAYQSNAIALSDGLYITGKMCNSCEYAKRKIKTVHIARLLFTQVCSNANLYIICTFSLRCERA